MPVLSTLDWLLLAGAVVPVALVCASLYAALARTRSRRVMIRRPRPRALRGGRLASGEAIGPRTQEPVRAA